MVVFETLISHTPKICIIWEYGQCFACNRKFISTRLTWSHHRQSIYSHWTSSFISGVHITHSLKRMDSVMKKHNFITPHIHIQFPSHYIHDRTSRPYYIITTVSEYSENSRKRKDSAHDVRRICLKIFTHFISPNNTNSIWLGSNTAILVHMFTYGTVEIEHVDFGLGPQNREQADSPIKTCPQHKTHVNHSRVPH